MNSLQILYSLWIACSAALTLNSLSARAFARVGDRFLLAHLATLVSEFSHFAIIIKLAVLHYSKDSSIWLENKDGSMCDAIGCMYWADIIVLLTLWGVFLKSYFSRNVIYENTKFYRDSTSSEPPKVFSISFIFRFLNPMWEGRVKVHNDISYMPADEIKGRSNREKCMWELDILQHPSFPKNRPVLLFIHSELWTSGSKSDHPPVLSYLALRHYVVVSMNYRLAPKATFQEQLIDVKTVLKWIKGNIATYGGDPSFIAISGASTGAHLAMMAAMTPNTPELQPGFEDINTRVQACISINGFYDVTNFKNRFGYKVEKLFSKLAEHDDDYWRDCSPIWRLMEAKAKKSLFNASPAEKLGLELPPFLVIQYRLSSSSGQADSIAPVSHVRDFCKYFKNTVFNPRLCYIELEVF